jgi:hypothetical protein
VPGEIGQVAGEGMTAFGGQVAELVISGKPQEASRLFPWVVDVASHPRHLRDLPRHRTRGERATPLDEAPGVDEEEIRRYFERSGLGGRFDELKRLLELRAATKADVEALRASARGARPMKTEDYFRFLSQFTVAEEVLRRRPVPRHGEPFRL